MRRGRPIGTDFQLYSNLSARGKFQSVIKQVHEDLFQLCRICLNRGAFFRDRDHQFDVRLTLFGIKLFDDIVNNRTRRRFFELYLHPSRFNLGKIEKAVDEVQLIFGIQENAVEKILDLFVKIARSYSAVSDS